MSDEDEPEIVSLLGRAQSVPGVQATGAQSRVAGIAVGLTCGVVFTVFLLGSKAAAPAARVARAAPQPVPRRAAEAPLSVEASWARGFETPLRDPATAAQRTRQRQSFWREAPRKPSAPIISVTTVSDAHAGFELVGTGHVAGHDAPGAPQPGNVSEAECAAHCRRVPSCSSFAYFPEPMWSATSECYLKGSCFENGGLDDVGGGTRTWRKKPCQARRR